MEANIETARISIKRKEIEAAYHRQLRQAEQLKSDELSRRRSLTIQAAAFSALKENLLRASRDAASTPALRAAQTGLCLSALRKQRAGLEQSGKELEALKSGRLAQGMRVVREKMKLEKLESLLKQAVRLQEGDLQAAEEEALMEQAALPVPREAEIPGGCGKNSLEDEVQYPFDARESADAAPGGDGIVCAGGRSEPSFGALTPGGGQALSSQDRSPRQPGGESALAAAPRRRLPPERHLQEFASQVAAVKCWENFNGSGIELEYQSSSGRRTRVIVRRGRDEAVNICLVPEFESDRRILWMEKSKIVEALQLQGLRVGRVAVRKG